MSKGGVMLVKNSNSDSRSNHKTKVILHVQSMAEGTNCDIADSGTTVLAVEAKQEDSIIDGDEVEYGYPITCGDSKAVLLFKKFVCPGINVRCVKFNNQLISPKQFVHLAGKATLKDWKRAIRLGGVMLRKMMDSGQIDFYQHDTACTNTCRSTKFDLLINHTRMPLSAIIPQPSSSSPLPGVSGQVEVKLEDAGCLVVEPSSSHMIQTVANGEVKKETEDISEDPLSFWQSLADMGLMGEVVSKVRSELLALLRGVEQRSQQENLQHTDAVVLSAFTQMFGLLDSVRQVLELHRGRTGEEQHQLQHALKFLESQLFNQKLLHEDWRTRLSFPFHVKQSVPSSFRPPPNKRAKVENCSSAFTSASFPFFMLPGFAFSPLSQALSLAGIPTSTLAQLAPGYQLLTHHSGLPGALKVKGEASDSLPTGVEVTYAEDGDKNGRDVDAEVEQEEEHLTGRTEK
ncbi:glucocorticoid modulatory element-binding protein 1-like isoform X2 [Denticeps clupeoides]|uniref:SAND domain-containing protein n=1 Tax=Denticeps clupeoides TaxID=299321 RepID=A0AAY4CT78_9TELE|nr:glucocorticoid modulatory element-binding protein 1 isoform X2 [Denticeps clupeoides]